MPRHKQPEYLPMTGRILREKKHHYVVIIKFTKSRRVYATETVYATSQKMVKAMLSREHPQIHWVKK